MSESLFECCMHFLRGQSIEGHRQAPLTECFRKYTIVQKTAKDFKYYINTVAREMPHSPFSIFCLNLVEIIKLLKTTKCFKSPYKA